MLFFALTVNYLKTKTKKENFMICSTNEFNYWIT